MGKEQRRLGEGRMMVRDPNLFIKIEISRDLHNKLTEAGKKGETYDDIIRRLIK